MADEPNIDSIFCRAVEITSETDRYQFLERACGTNAELRARLEKLLAAHWPGWWLHARRVSRHDRPAVSVSAGTGGESHRSLEVAREVG